MMKKALPSYTTHPVQPLARIMARVENEFNNRNAPALRLRLPPYNFVMLREPELLRKVLIDQEMSLRKNVDDLWRFRWIMPKGGTVNPGTPDCIPRKRKIQRAMVEPSLSYYADSLPPIFDAFINEWNQRTEPFDANRESAKLAVRATLQMFFSKTVTGEELETLSHKIEFIHHNFFNRMPQWLPTPNKYTFMRYATEMRALFQGYLDERRASGEDIPDMLGIFQNLTYDDGTPYPDHEIIDEICSKYFGSTALIAGTAWLIYWIAAHPHTLEKARAEVMALDDPSMASARNLSKLPYCRMIAKEAMRLTPPFWSLAPRIATTLEDDEYDIPTGSRLLLSLHHTHRHPAHWEHPHAFYPEHFLPETEKARHAYAYLPFGKGARSCVGMHISLMFLQLLVAMIAARSKVEHLPSNPKNPVPIMGFETVPSEVRVRFTPYAH